MIRHTDPNIKGETTLDIHEIKVWSWRKFRHEQKFICHICWQARGWDVVVWKSDLFDTYWDCWDYCYKVRDFYEQRNG